MNENGSNEAPRHVVELAAEMAGLRDRIWDYLFETKSTYSLDEIAMLVERDVASVRAAVNHEWFRVAGDQISIAYSVGGAQPPLRSSY